MGKQLQYHSERKKMWKLSQYLKHSVTLEELDSVVDTYIGVVKEGKQPGALCWEHAPTLHTEEGLAHRWEIGHHLQIDLKLS